MKIVLNDFISTRFCRIVAKMKTSVRSVAANDLLEITMLEPLRKYSRLKPSSSDQENGSMTTIRRYTLLHVSCEAMTGKKGIKELTRENLRDYVHEERWYSSSVWRTFLNLDIEECWQRHDYEIHKEKDRGSFGKLSDQHNAISGFGSFALPNISFVWFATIKAQVPLDRPEHSSLWNSRSPIPDSASSLSFLSTVKERNCLCSDGEPIDFSWRIRCVVVYQRVQRISRRTGSS